MTTSDVIAIFALLVSVFSLWEAKKARKTTQAQELAPHFINVGYLWSLVMQEGGDNKDVEAGKKSIDFLMHRLSFDKDFHNCIKDLIKWADEASLIWVTEMSPSSMTLKKPEAPTAAVAAKKVFDQKQRHYVSIG